MKFSSVSLVRLCVAIFLISLGAIIYEAYKQIVTIREQRKQLLYNFYDENLYNDTYIDTLDERFEERKAAVAKILRTKAQIRMINTKQRIYNKYQFGPVTSRTIVIAIQVHSNIIYLRELIDALKNAFGIKDSLLIFSHDHFDESINKLIRNISFAKYIQIFYPFSIQLHPKIFPGIDQKLCTEEFDCVKSNIRDPQAAQSKHHWWWQVNHIFDHLEITKIYNRSIIFLEDDNYVTDDFIYIFQLLKAVKHSHCPYCEILSLGANDPSLFLYDVYKGVISIKTWDNLLHKRGIAFDRSVWNIIKASSYDFCYFNDCDWDNSLKHVAAKRQGMFMVVAIEGPRVFRFEKCDDENASCRVEYKINEVKNFVRLITKDLYFEHPVINVTNSYEFTPNASGSFEDIRDKELCMYFTKNEVLF